MNRHRRDNEERVKVTHDLPVSLRQKLKEIAIAERRSLNDQLIVLLEKAIERQKAEAI